MEKQRHVNIPIFVPHKGCPHTCVFCDQRKISGELSEQTPKKAAKLIEECLSTIEGYDNTEIAFFGGSFTGIPEPEMVKYLEAARPYIESGRVSGIRLSTRPDAIDPHVLDLLESYGVTTIELGVQSLDPLVLEQSQRGHTVADVIHACRLIRERGFKLGIQTMVGLPGDTLEKTLKTAQGVIDLKPDMVRIYPVLVLKGTYLEIMMEKGHYTPLDVEQAVSWCAQIVPLYRMAGITLLKMGLHASETLEGSVVAGPYHPAFGELVESRIIKDKLMVELEKLNPDAEDSIIIRTRPELVSQIIGQKRTNLESLKQAFSFSKVQVIPDLREGDYRIEKEIRRTGV